MSSQGSGGKNYSRIQEATMKYTKDCCRESCSCFYAFEAGARWAIEEAAKVAQEHYETARMFDSDTMRQRALEARAILKTIRAFLEDAPPKE